MFLAFLKPIALVSVGCGLVVPSIILSGKGGLNTTKVFLIAKSKNDMVRLYVKENQLELKKEDPKRVDIKLELVADYKGQKVPKEWMLCSPTQDRNKYFLLKSTTESYHTSWKTIDEVGKSCEYLRSNEGLGEPLKVKLEEKVTTNIPKAIYLQHCQIKDLREDSNRDTNTNKPSLELTCSVDEWNRENKTVKLLDQGFIFI